MSAVATTAYSFGLSDDPGSDAAVTCTLGAFRPVDRGQRLGAEDLLAILGVIIAHDDHGETPIFQISVQLNDVIGNEMGCRESARRMGASQVEQVENVLFPSGRGKAVQRMRNRTSRRDPWETGTRSRRSLSTRYQPLSSTAYPRCGSAPMR